MQQGAAHFRLILGDKQGAVAKFLQPLGQSDQRVAVPCGAHRSRNRRGFARQVGRIAQDDGKGVVEQLRNDVAQIKHAALPGRRNSGQVGCGGGRCGVGRRTRGSRYGKRLGRCQAGALGRGLLAPGTDQRLQAGYQDIGSTCAGKHLIQGVFLLRRSQTGVMRLQLRQHVADDGRPLRLLAALRQVFDDRRGNALPAALGNRRFELAGELQLIGAGSWQAGLHGFQFALGERSCRRHAGDFKVQRPVVVGGRLQFSGGKQAQGLACDFSFGQLLGVSHDSPYDND